MSDNPCARRLASAFLLACALLVLLSEGAHAAEPHPHTGRLPGFPVIRGVVPVLGSKASLAAHEKLVNEAFTQARRRHPGVKGAAEAEPNEKFLAPCENEAHFFETQDVCYRGGTVLRDPTLHLIFWQGSLEKGKPVDTGVQLFPEKYEAIVERYFGDLAKASGASTNVFSVDSQYGDENAGKYVPGEYVLSFNPTTDVFEDTVDPLPTQLGSKCTDKETPTGPCLIDSELHKEVENAAKLKGWPISNLNNVYVVLTPRGVGGCFEEESTECAYVQYCAYHGDFGGNGETPGNQTIYADLPYIGEMQGCDFGVHPNEPASRAEEEKGQDSGADAVIDTASHELNESITDPLGSQCKTGAKGASECERNAWTDAIGQEVGDKCVPPEVTLDGTYGEPLGELLPGHPSSLFNQEIGGDFYWTQREWSNEAGVLEGGCVQRTIQARFSLSANPAATVPSTFDGSTSGAPGDPAAYWVWNFGEGEQVGTTSPTTTHTYPKAGEYLVTLTAYDAYGNARATLGIITVAPAPPVPVPPPAPTVTVKEVKVPVAHYSSAQIAALLGLPASGARVHGSSRITLGHASCPPACAVSANLYATVTSKKHHHQRVLVGKLASNTVTSAQQPIVLDLSASARKLLRAYRRLTVTLKLTVVGQEGASWSISRSLTLTG